MKKVVYFIFAIGVLSSCGSAGRYCTSTPENNQQETITKENQNVVVADKEINSEAFSLS